MVQKSSQELDPEELFHLAVRASGMGNHEEAIRMLKRSLEQRPDAKTVYILAAEHAEIGMYDRALEGMRKATEMDPSLWIAHFQSGLINMMLQDKDAAVASWKSLETLDDQDPLHHFGKGLSLLLNNQFTEAAEKLEAGISLNRSNPSLTRDMAAILERIRNTTQRPTEPEIQEVSQQPKPHGHIFLSSYNTKDD